MQTRFCPGIPVHTFTTSHPHNLSSLVFIKVFTERSRGKTPSSTDSSLTTHGMLKATKLCSFGVIPVRMADSHISGTFLSFLPIDCQQPLNADKEMGTNCNNHHIKVLSQRNQCFQPKGSFISIIDILFLMHHREFHNYFKENTRIRNCILKIVPGVVKSKCAEIL